MNLSTTRNVITAVSMACFLSIGITANAFEDAEVLPRGVFRAGVEGRFYSSIDEKYNDSGDTEDVAKDFNAPLDSSVFPLLSVVEMGFGMPAGSASIGESEVSYDYKFQIYEFIFQYGLTDKISLGVKAPYWHVKNNVSAESDPTNATVGFNPLFGTGSDPFGSPVIPIALGGIPLTTGAVQKLLGPGLGGIPGYGFDPIEDWSASGFSDIEAGMRYQYYKSDDWRLALTSGVRFPTGAEDDPDNLQDYALGFGTYALLFFTNNDYTGIENLTLNATLKYYLVLSDEVTKRVPDDVDSPITRHKEQVDRDRGDVFEFDTSAKYSLGKGFSVGLFYRYGYKPEDDVSGNMGYNYESLEDETDYTVHVYKVGLSYTTVPLYAEKKFPVPLKAFVEYRDRFAGRNVLKSKYISLGLQIFF